MNSTLSRPLFEGLRGDSIHAGARTQKLFLHRKQIIAPKPDPSGFTSNNRPNHSAATAAKLQARERKRPLKKFMTVSEMAARLKIPVRTAHWIVQKGQGPDFVKIGRHIRIALDDFDRWLAASAKFGPELERKE